MNLSLQNIIIHSPLPTGKEGRATKPRWRRPFTDNSCLKSDNYTVMQHHVTAPVACAFKCQWNPECYSFNFYEETPVPGPNCHLNDDYGRNTTDFEIKNGCHYYTLI